MPVAAVSGFGIPTVNPGSRREMFDMFNGVTMARFRHLSVVFREVSVIMAPCETSLPVPAVVGMQMSGGMSSRMRSLPPTST